jgi:ComF family protein
MSLRDLADACLAALLSPPCAACGRVLDRPLNGAVCASCWTSIVRGGPTLSIQWISRASAIGPYEGTLREILHALKYEGRRSVAPQLSEMMATDGAEILRTADFVVPVPLHPRRERERGFNQADDLARGLGLPVVRALRRERPTAPQVGLSREERAANVHGAFIHCGEDPFQQPPVIVLVDDVMTTGATLEACARVLKSAGAADVRALTAARVVSAGH